MFVYDMPPLTSYEVAEVINIEEYNKEGDNIMKPLDKIDITSGYTGSKKWREYKLNGKIVRDHHYGVDIVGGKKIYATADGKVVKVVNKGSKGGVMCLVRIQHKEYQSAYYHCESGSVRVKVGEYVKKGQHIANVGNTGKVTGKHLHFQIDKGSNTTAINPTAYAKGNKELKGLSKPSKDWETGEYKLLKEKYLRKTPEVTATNKYKYKNLTPNAKVKCFQDKLGYAKYKIGAIVQLNEFTNDKKGNTWGRTSTLWVCVHDDTGNQVEKI